MADRKTLLDLSKLQLRGYLKGSKYPPSLKVGIYQNNPQITVYSNLESAPHKGIITAGMDFQTLHLIFKLIRDIVNEDGGGEQIIYEIENKYKPRDSKELMVKNKTIIGKDAEGVVFISVIDSNPEMPKVKFEFGVNYYHGLVRKGGLPPLTKAEVSCRSAVAWADLFQNVVMRVAADIYEPVDYNANKGGGNNNSYGSNKNNSSHNDVSDDDLMF